MGHAAAIADEVCALPDRPERAPQEEEALGHLERCATTLRDLRAIHRKASLGSVASGRMSADEAMTRVDLVRRLDAITHYAWRSAAHLVGRGA
jgi:phosphate:Na+ symporter